MADNAPNPAAPTRAAGSRARPSANATQPWRTFVHRLRAGIALIALCLLVLALAAAWAPWALHPCLWVLIRMYQLGEAVGITAVTPAPNAALGGQILGINYHRPPQIYQMFARSVAGIVVVAPVVVLSAWAHGAARRRRGWSPRHETGALTRVATLFWPRAGAGIAAAAALFGIIDSPLSQRVWSASLWLGEQLGGTVQRLSGMTIQTTRGPFVGGRWADTLGNLLVTHAPLVVTSAAASLAGISLIALCARIAGGIRPDELACEHCGYPRAGLQLNAHCPECGRTPALECPRRTNAARASAPS